MAKHRRLSESSTPRGGSADASVPTLPESWRALLDAFRPAFRRSRTFALFALLATGLVTQTTRRTILGMLAGAGMAAVVSFHAVCRFFSHHAWDTDRIGL